jgi:hypothetical protein
MRRERRERAEDWRPRETPPPAAVVLDGHISEAAMEVVWPRLIGVLRPGLTRQQLRHAVEEGRAPGSKETFGELCVRRGLQIWDLEPWDERVQPDPRPAVEQFVDQLSRLDAALEQGDRGTINRISERLRDWGEVLALMSPARGRGRPEEWRRWVVVVEYARKMGLVDSRLQYVPRRGRTVDWADLVERLRAEGLAGPGETPTAVRQGVLRFLGRQRRAAAARVIASTP